MLAGKLKDQIKPPTRPAPLPKPTAPLTLPGQGAGPDTTPLKHPGGKVPEIAAAAPPAKDPLEEFRKADRESIKGLEASRKPKPTHRDAERTGEQRLTRKIEEETRDFLQLAKIANFGSRGVPEIPGAKLIPNIKIDRTIAAFERFLDGKGGVVSYDPKWMLRHKVISGAALRIQGHFANWMSGKRIPKDPKELIVGKLLALKPGQRITGSPRFDGEYSFDKARDKFSDHRLLLGNGFIKARGKFVFTRRGNIIEVTGRVENKISDPFDFTSGRISRFGFGQQISHDDMIWLEKHGKAKPFEVRSVWRRKMVWRLQIVHDPKTGKDRLVGIGPPNWAEAK